MVYCGHIIIYMLNRRGRTHIRCISRPFGMHCIGTACTVLTSELWMRLVIYLILMTGHVDGQCSTAVTSHLWLSCRTSLFW